MKPIVDWCPWLFEVTGVKTTNILLIACKYDIQNRNGKYLVYICLVYRFITLRERSLLFLVQVKGHWISRQIKMEKLKNTISHVSNHGCFSHFGIPHTDYKILFWVEVKLYLGSVTRRRMVETTKTWYLIKGNIDTLMDVINGMWLPHIAVSKSWA